MLKKIIAIKSVGRFKNAPAQGGSPFAQHTLIVGANGYGKTTLCAILRSLQSGEASHVTGRKSLGAADAPSIDILLSTGNARFDGAAWNVTLPVLSIFDGMFVAENVHSGDVVALDHKRNLYRVIIGREGVRLAEEDRRLAGQSRDKTGEISTTTKALQSHLPAGMRLDAFLALPADPDIDTKITEQQRKLEAVRQSSAVKARAALSEVSVPAMPDGFADLLSRTIDTIAQDAEGLLAKHLSAHGMKGVSWISDGLEHASETCPFCGQGLQGLALIAAYRAIFSANYKATKAAIEAMRQQVAQRFGEGVAGRLDTIAEQNKGAVEYWQRYCTFELDGLGLPANVAASQQALGMHALQLLERKARSPLEVVVPDAAYSSAVTAYEAAVQEVAVLNAAVKSANLAITAKKAELGTAEVKTAEAEQTRLVATKTRHTAEIAKLCSDYAGLLKEKETLEAQKKTARTALDAHTEQVVKPYEARINALLDAFNAGFRISETTHSYPGGTATSSYQLVIDSRPIDVGDERTPADQPSFKNTLSAGDRTTLALAFFLAHLEIDGDLSQKIVVFDDPFSSQDAFRRRQTVHEIIRVAKSCKQVIVLSHDAPFLKQVWDKAPPATRSALQIYNARALGSRIQSIDLDAACQGRTATDIDDLQTYISSGAGAPLDIIRKMRVVLEAHCRTTYSASFSPGDWLGDMVGSIRAGGDQHVAWSVYDELDQINDYTKEYHHGEDTADATPDAIDPTELTGYVRRTLRVVNALQA